MKDKIDEYERKAMEYMRNYVWKFKDNIELNGVNYIYDWDVKELIKKVLEEEELKTQGEEK